MDDDWITAILNNVRASLDEVGWVDEGEKTYFDQQRGRYEFMLRYLSEQVVSGQLLLDVGSHVLHFGMAASALGYQVWGTDVELFVRHPMNKPRRERYGICEVRVCDLSRDVLPYEDQTFDVVNFSETLEHLNFNPLPVVKELYRVLKPGGIVLITTPNALRLGSRIRLLMGHNIFADLKNLCWGDPYSAHYREYSLSEVAKLLQWGGFGVIVQQAKYMYPEIGMRKVLKTVIAKLIPSLVGNLFVVGAR
jgi:SAM-dependent methyltransferase